VRYREASIDELRSRLGDEELQRAFARGQGLSFEEGFTLALGVGQSG
jgi:hypothetical protein